MVLLTTLFPITMGKSWTIPIIFPPSPILFIERCLSGVKYSIFSLKSKFFSYFWGIKVTSAPVSKTPTLET